MIQIEYVISAPGWGVIPNRFMQFKHLPEFKKAMLEVGDLLNTSVAKKCKNTIPKVSSLFNAHTEKVKVKEINELTRMGFERLYADSGGLQNLTLDSQITPQIKNDIYKVQTNADFAFCFDEIPLKIQGERGRNERSNVLNKTFDPADCGPLGEQTGKNVKEQVELFQKLGAKTKVILICHGHEVDDFLRYYDSIASQLEDHDYANIGGISIAKTAAGNKAKESIILSRAAKKIASICHPNVRQQMHILGVGAISKLRPLIYLIRSGFLTEYPILSYDSSSHTSCFDYGLLKINGRCEPLGKTRTPRGVAHFKNVYTMFEPILKNYLTVKEYLDNIYCGPPEIKKNPIIDIFAEDGTPTWPFRLIRQKAFDNPNKNVGVIGMLSKTLHTYYQVDNFCWNVDKLFRETEEELRAKVTDAIELNHLLLLNEATTDDRLAKLQQKLDFKSRKTESLDDMSENVNNLVGICLD